MAENHKQPEMQALIEQHFDREFYLQTYADVANAGMDAIDHYKLHGWMEGRISAPWFDPAEYNRRMPDLIENGHDPFVHFLVHGDVDGAKRAFEKAGSPATGRPMRNLLPGKRRLADEVDIYMIRPPSAEDIKATTPHFDEHYYLAMNPDVADSLINPLLHFLSIGWIEGRDPTSDFSVRYYLKQNKDVRTAGLNPFVHYCRHGRNEKWRVSAGVAEATVLTAFETSEKLQEMVREACALEPMVALPDVRRNANIPLRSRHAVADAARALREAMEGRSYSHVIMVPHVRMSGAARVSSVYGRVLANIVAGERVLVISTDGSNNEYRHWFGDDCDFFDVSAVFAKVDTSEREALLYDLLRGVDAKAIHNVNSNLAWRAMEIYGRQLSQEFRVFTYLFTWDESARGARVGYPIQWLRHTCDYHHVIFTDSHALADDIRARFGYDGKGGTEVIALHTPADSPDFEVQMRTVVSRKAPVFLWAGRFDRQKRTDILLEIAKANPQANFHIYGKAVLDQQGLTQENLPSNCLLKGTYQTLEEVFDSEVYAGFLYTAQWDGIPTILLDMGAIGLPVIAPAVGGIPELINDQTGYLIADFEDVEAYGDAIKQISEKPAEAIARASALKDHLASDFSETHYARELKEALTRNGL